MNRRHPYLVRTFYGVAAAAATVTLIANCSVPGTSEPEPTDTITMPTDTTSTQNRPDDAYPDTVTDFPPTSTVPVLELGESHTYPDGLTITLIDSGTMPAGDYGTPSTVLPGAPVPIITIEVTNGTGQPYDPTLIDANMMRTDTGEYVSSMVANDGIFWSGLILPGDKAVKGSAYDIEPGTPATLTVNAGYDREQLIVTMNR